jgi:hypothetical protein
MTDDPADFADRVLLGARLERHPAMAGLDELAAELHDVDVPAAVDRLSGDGLANRLGERGDVSRAAARFDALKPV